MDRIFAILLQRSRASGRIYSVDHGRREDTLGDRYGNRQIAVLVHRIDRKLVRSHRQVLNIEFIHQRLGLDDLLGFAIHDLDTLRDLILGIGPLQQHTLIARRSRQVRNLARIYRSREVILVQFIHVAARRDSERQQQNA